MEKADFLSIEHDTIDIIGVERLVEFSRYNPHTSDVFLQDLELAEDLNIKSGASLYPEGTIMNHKRIERLIKLHESSPSLTMVFKFKRSPKIVNNFRKEIKEKIKELIKHSNKNKVFRQLLSGIVPNINAFMDDVLKDEKITLLIYKMMFICETSKSKKANLYFSHSLNVAIFSLAIASSKNYEEIINKDNKKLKDVFIVGLLHNYGAIIWIEKILKSSEEKMLKVYWDENRNGYYYLGLLRFSFDIMDSIRCLCEYHMDRNEFIHRDGWADTIANLVLVVESFLREENGLFGMPKSMREVVDGLNVKMMDKKLNGLAVQTLTAELELTDIFDFYEELHSLIDECKYDNSAVAYPITGFKSPTIFVCSKQIDKCPYIEASVKAISLVKDMGVLTAGKYHRCLLLTPKLFTFYKKHYKEIKKEKENDK
ncbi:hypothetical protein ACFL6K_02700 [Candidatus Latescibacterota bacterium]